MNHKDTKSQRKIGILGEGVAEKYLQQNGYTILEKNYYYNHGEIDIVAKDGNVLVFVEVKSRKTDQFGKPEESVTPKKQELLRRTAEGYVSSKNVGEMECRFDVVSVIMKNGKTECELLKNCF